MVKIGNQTIDTNIFLAPLSGCSDLSFRLICREEGARFCFFEMLDSNCIVRSRPQTLGILKTNEKDLPIAGQLLGSDPSMMAEAAQKLLSLVRISFLDINCACPAKKVIKKKAGSYLLKEPRMLQSILKKVSSSIKIPMTIKMRLGHDTKDTKKAVELANICEASGAAALFVHGRTGSQGYKGDVDHLSIRAIKEAVNIPVFGIGNIFTPQDAKNMLDGTSSDGIMIARGAMGNPWIFRETEEYLKHGRTGTVPDFSYKKRVLKRHLSYVNRYKDMRESTKIGFMRKVAIWYLKDFRKSGRVRDNITRIKKYDELINFIDILDTD